MTKHDCLLLCSIIICSLLGLLFLHFYNTVPDQPIAQIMVNGSLIKQIDLTNPLQNRLIKIKGYRGICRIETKKGAIRMLDAPCPDHICVKTGWISHNRQMIVCVPNRVSIKIIEKNRNNDIDTIAR